MRISDWSSDVCSSDLDAPAGIARAFPSGDIGDAIGDALGGLSLARHRQAIDPDRIGSLPGSRCIDHGARQQALLSARIAIAAPERPLAASPLRALVLAAPRIPGPTPARLHVRLDRT